MIFDKRKFDLIRELQEGTDSRVSQIAITNVGMAELMVDVTTTVANMKRQITQLMDRVEELEAKAPKDQDGSEGR